MSFKDELNNEMNELKKVKKPYESAAFLIFAILIFQQLVFLVKALVDFIGKTTTFFSTNVWCNSNLMGFVSRIIGIKSSSWLFVILGIAAYVFYYFLIYIFVWNYCKKHNLAKWTWTLFVVFGPTMLLIPSYIFFVAYAYRSYLVRFAKRVAMEFKEYDINKPMPEEIEETNLEEPIKE